MFHHVLGETVHITTEYLTNEEKVVMANSKVDALEVENSKLSKDNRNQLKEQVKALIDDLKAKKLLTEQKDEQPQLAKREVSKAGDNAMQTFQLTDEYNGVLLCWYFKGFELLRRYLTKRKPEVDLKSLDFEDMDKEMESNETNVVEGVVPESSVDEGAGQDDPVV